MNLDMDDIRETNDALGEASDAFGYPDTSRRTTVTMRYFAGIAHAAGVSEETIEIPSRGALASTLINILAGRHGDEFAAKLGICALMTRGKRLQFTDHLPDTDSIDIDVLPPFAGG